jgi:hypothetical protein
LTHKLAKREFTSIAAPVSCPINFSLIGLFPSFVFYSHLATGVLLGEALLPPRLLVPLPALLRGIDLFVRGEVAPIIETGV